MRHGDVSRHGEQIAVEFVRPAAVLSAPERARACATIRVDDNAAIRRLRSRNRLASGTVPGHSSEIKAPEWLSICSNRFWLLFGPIWFSPPANTATVRPARAALISSMALTAPQCAARRCPARRRIPPDVRHAPSEGPIRGRFAYRSRLRPVSRRYPPARGMTPAPSDRLCPIGRAGRPSRCAVKGRSVGWANRVMRGDDPLRAVCCEPVSQCVRILAGQRCQTLLP